MPYDITWETKGLFKRFYGFATVNEFKESVTLVHEDTRFASISYSINDLLAVDGLSTQELCFGDIISSEITSHLKNLNLRTAIVTKDTALIKYLGEYAKVPGAFIAFKIFPDLESARLWAAADPGLEVNS